MKRHALLLVAGLAACGEGGSSGTPLPAGADAPEILFCRSRSDDAHRDTQVRKASLRGLGDVRVIDRGGVESGVRVAPDGNRMVYARERSSGDPESRELFVATIDGSEGELRLTIDTAVDDAPCWSPDGDWIAFSSDRLGSGRRIFVIRRDGSDATPLYDDDTEQRAPDWSWAADRIAFARTNSAGRSEIWTVDPAGRDGARVTDSGTGPGQPDEPPGDHDPTWSPDGRELLFARDVGPGIRELTAIDIAQGTVRTLTPPDGVVRLPRWSPHADRMFFVADRPAEGIHGRRLWVAEADGSDRLLVFADRRHDFVGFDTLPDLGPAPDGPVEDIDAEIAASTVSNGVGRTSRGSLDNVLDGDGILLGIATDVVDGRNIAGIELDVPLPISDPRDALVLEFTAIAALTEADSTSVLRLSIANFVENRNDTVVEIAPIDGQLRTLTFRLASLQHVSREGRARVAIIGDNPLENPGELLIDEIRLRVRRPDRSAEGR